MGIWSWIRGIGGNPDEEAALDKELGRQDPGAEEEKYLSEAAYGAGFAAGDAAGAAEDDLEELKPPRDPAP
jgi:hypothetical protein